MKRAISSERTRNYLRQIKGSFAFKLIALAASFLTLPLMIQYLGEEQFGVWSTLLTAMTWLVFFDFGVGNGLRNMVATALAQDKQAEAANFIASGYTIVGIISFVLWAFIFAISYVVPWQVFFNTGAISEGVLRTTVQLSASLILLNFWVGLITALLGAIQKTSLVTMGQMVTNVLILLFVYLLLLKADPLISQLALVYGFALVSSNILLNVIFFKSRRKLLPRPYLDSRHMRPLLSTGLKFFVIQLAVLVIFTTDKLLITQLFGPSKVTQYDVVFKLFSVITIVNALISGPLWSAYTEAHQKHDFTWISAMLKRQLLILSALIVLTICLAMVATPVIEIWIGKDFQIPPYLVATMVAFVTISAWNTVFAMFINGTGEIQLQLYTALMGMILNIPLSLFFAQYIGLGIGGIVTGTAASLLFSAIALPLQARQIIRRLQRSYAL